MPEKCVVFSCSNVRSKEKGILLHPIPFYGKNESEKQKRRKKWVDFVKSKRAHWEPTEHSAVCSGHFKEEDYTNRFADDLVRRLKRDEIVSICLMRVFLIAGRKALVWRTFNFQLVIFHF